jgi:hypothetical protein
LSHIIIIIIIMCWRLVWKFSVGENDDDWCETTWCVCVCVCVREREREREREVCVILLTHYFVQWCICFTSSLLQTIGIHGMHTCLLFCFDGWLLVVKVHSPIISSCFLLKKNHWVGFKGYQYQKKFGCQVYQTKNWVLFQITGWEPLGKGLVYGPSTNGSQNVKYSIVTLNWRFSKLKGSVKEPNLKPLVLKIKRTSQRT